MQVFKALEQVIVLSVIVTDKCQFLWPSLGRKDLNRVCDGSKKEVEKFIVRSKKNT